MVWLIAKAHALMTAPFVSLCAQPNLDELKALVVEEHQKTVLARALVGVAQDAQHFLRHGRRRLRVVVVRTEALISRQKVRCAAEKA